MSVSKHENKFGLNLGATWNTAVTTTTNDGIYFQSFDGFNLEPEFMVDIGAGLGIETSIHKGNDKPPEPSFIILPYENDHTAQLILAMIMGADAITGAGDPYTHTMGLQSSSAYFATIIGQTGTEIKTIPSAVVASLEIAPNTQGIVEFRGKLIGSTVTVAGSVGSLTYKTDDYPFKGFQDFVFRINDQDGADFGAGDEVNLSDWKIMINRYYNVKVVTGGVIIVQPVENRLPSMELEFTIPHKSADSIQFYTDMRAETAKKFDMTWSGTTASRELLLQSPNGKFESVTDPNEDVVSTVARFRLLQADAAPTGMTVSVPTFVWQNDEATSQLA